MNVANQQETVVNTVVKIQVTGEECRICLKKCNQVWEMFHHATDEIPRKLMACAAVQVEEGDGLPAIICQTCRRLLDVSYEFKCQAEQSDARLREILVSKISVQEETKILTLTHSENVAIGEAIAEEIAQEHASDCAELVNALTNGHMAAQLNQHHFTAHQHPIIFEIQPPQRHDESIIEEAINNENVVCDVSDVTEEKNLQLCDSQENRVVDVLMEKYADLNSSIETTERLGKQETSMMDTEESERDSDEENEECVGENSAACKNIEATTTVVVQDSHNDDEDDVKEENYESDEEERPLICRTQRQKCPHCIKTFATKCGLERHVEVHKNKTKLRYVCYMCDKQFSNIAKLKSHVLSSHDSLRSNEDKTAGEESEEAALVRTEKSCTRSDGKKGMKFSCKVCGKQFTYQKSFITHAKTHPGYQPEETTNNEKDENVVVGASEDSNERGNESEEEEEDDEDMPLEGLQCTQCGKLFATKRNLKRHITTHSGLKFHCSTCGKEFSRIDKLKEHEQSKHNEELFASSDSDSDDDTDNENKNHDGNDSRKKEKHNRPHQCPMCPKAFAQEQSLTNHMERHKRVKDTQKRFLCEVCSKCFAQSGSLVAHMRTHTGVKPYVCSVCSRAFTKSTYLQLHLRTHSGEKPYICQYCSRAFARANTLARHITMHTGEAKYHCQICMKSFRRLTSLNEHTYTHTGQRPYACKICTKRYNNAGSLYAHTKKCKAQQLSGTTTTTTYTIPAVEETVHQNGTSASSPQMMLYSQRKLVDDSTVGQVNPTSQFIITNVHNPSLKPLPTNIIPQFTVEDPNFCAVNKAYKNSYYTIYPNMHIE